MTSSVRPLDGIRVVAIALNTPGPLAAARLREAGAHVVKVEPRSGDPLAQHCRSWYEQLHRGIDIERVDLKSEEGRARLTTLLADADLFLASQRPSALARLGLDADTLLRDEAATPRLRHLNIVGELARPEIPGHDLTYLARAGLIGAELPRTLMADVLGSERVFSTALLLLQQPPGARAEVGLYDSLAPLMAPLEYGLTKRGGLLGGGLPAYGIYEARDGRVAVAALEPHFRARLYRELGLAMSSELAETFRTRTAAEWEAWALARDLPISAM